jgi:hypothetical protein
LKQYGKLSGGLQATVHRYSVAGVFQSRALRQVVSIAQGEGLDKAIFATDCLSLMQRLNSPTMDRSPVGVGAEEIKTLVMFFFLKPR